MSFSPLCVFYILTFFSLIYALLESLYLEQNEDLEGQVPSLLCRHKEQGILNDFTIQCTSQKSKVDCSCCDHCNGKAHGGLPSAPNVEVELTDRQKMVLDKLKIISGSEVTELRTPQNKASYWIIEEDEGHYPAESEFLYQRYILAILHFMMKDGSSKMLNQISILDECHWKGIECDYGSHLLSIKLSTSS